MLKNYFIIAYRGFRRHPLYGTISLLGMASGLITALLILIYVVDEIKFDRFHIRGEHIYRIAHIRTTNHSETRTATTPLHLANFIKAGAPMVVNCARLLRESEGVMSHNDVKFKEPGVVFVDSAMVDMFTIEWIHGNSKSLLRGPNLIALSARTAVKYFGNEDPTGKSLTYRNWGQDYTYEVAGVYQDFPSQSHLHPEILIPFRSTGNLWNSMHGEDWYFSGAWTYIEISPSADPGSVEQALAGIAAKNLPDDLKSDTRFYLQPLYEIHLSYSLQGEPEANGNLRYVVLLGTVGIIILTIACINFINIAIARASLRVKEIGVRQSLGSSRKQLVKQFLGETCFYTFAAVLLTLLALPFLLPVFNSLSGKLLNMSLLGQFEFWGIFLAIFVFVVLLSGSYPAFYLSSQYPALMLKTGVLKSGKSGIRKFLIGFQFAALIALLAMVRIIDHQLDFMKNKGLGYDKESVAYINGYSPRQYAAFRKEIEGISGVKTVSAATGLPGSVNAGMFLELSRAQGLGPNDRTEVFRASVDDKFLPLMDLDLVEGRNFLPDESQQIVPCIVNESFLRGLPWQSDPLGREIEMFDMLGRSTGMREIVGVVRDFHVESLHSPIRPTVFIYTPRALNLVLRIEPNRLSEVRSDALALLRKDQDASGDFYILNQDLQQQYILEERLSGVADFFLWIAWLVATFGVFGLASFLAEQRLREMSIRRVIGANTLDVWKLFSKSFLWLAIVAFMIGAPLAYAAGTRWLDGFAYKASIPMAAYIAGPITLIGVVLSITGWHVWRISKVSPVLILRSE